MAKARGLKATAAERELERWLQARGFLVHRARRSGGKREGKFYSVSHDIFGVFDIIALHPDAYTAMPESPSGRRGATTWAIQVTTQAGRSARRRKIEKIGFLPEGWRISLVSHERTPDPAHRGRTKKHWRIEDWDGGKWLAPVAEEA